MMVLRLFYDGKNKPRMGMHLYDFKKLDLDII